MATSLEKVNALAAEYQGPPDGDADPIELVIRTAAQTVGPMFLQLLPDDAEQVDELLDTIAEQLLELKSDPPPTADVDGTAEPEALEAGPS